MLSRVLKADSGGLIEQLLSVYSFLSYHTPLLSVFVVTLNFDYALFLSS